MNFPSFYRVTKAWLPFTISQLLNSSQVAVGLQKHGGALVQEGRQRVGEGGIGHMWTCTWHTESLLKISYRYSVLLRWGKKKPGLCSVRGWHFIAKINDLVITISWLLATTLLCFLTISILGTDRPFKVIQPNIHPKLRIWQFHTWEIWGLWAKMSERAPSFFVSCKTNRSPYTVTGAPWAAMPEGREGVEVVGRGCLLGSGCCSHSPLLLALFLKARAASIHR